MQAALALQAAHEQGMVHRDIKPGNLMVTKKGVVTVLDFGLARLARGVDGYVSTTGSVVGTPVFMAPEQADDPKSVDIRADIYSLGCTLFLLLTGRPVFPKTDIMGLLRALALEEPPPLAKFRDDVPDGLEELVSRMLAKDRDDRPATPAEVARELTPFTAKRPRSLSKVPLNEELPFQQAKPSFDEMKMTAPRPGNLSPREGAGAMVRGLAVASVVVMLFTLMAWLLSQ